MGRSTSRSRVNGRSATKDAEGEVETLTTALQRLLDKLIEFQPWFTEEDVAAIPFPSEGSTSPTVSPPMSPRSSPSPSCITKEREHGGARRSISLSTTADSGRSALPSNDRELLRHGGEGKSSAVSSTATSSSFPAGPSPPPVMDLDAPLSASLFLTAVNIFDARLVLKSKRSSIDVVKLIHQAYALVWKDTSYLTALGLEQGVSTSAAGMQPVALQSRACPSSQRMASGSGGRGGRRGGASISPPPVTAPSPCLVLLVDACVQALLVYTNASMSLRHYVAYNEGTLRLFCIITCCARCVEEGERALTASATTVTSAMDCDVMVGDRNLQAELLHLEAVWRSCGVEGRVTERLRQAYMIEFLLDAALPPAVCSARYDGLRNIVGERKERVLGDIVSSRQGFAALMRSAPLQGLCGLSSISMFGEARLRARLLDKMTSEGVVERLFGEIATAMAEVLVKEEVGPSLTQKRLRGGASVESAPPRQRTRNNGSPPPCALQASAPQVQNTSHLRKGDAKNGDSSLDSSMTSCKSSAFMCTPAARIGHCVDILMLLTSPNLRLPEENYTTGRVSTSTAIRSTAWATRENIVRDVCFYLLIICFISKDHESYPELSSLQLQAADCIAQLAAYSGSFYSMVVDALDAVLDIQRGTNVERSLLESQDFQLHHNTVPGEMVLGGGGELRRVVSRVYPGEPAGLLPVVINLLQFPIHAQANAASIQKWFVLFSEKLLPDVFEASQLTSGRRSTSTWGRRRKQNFQTSGQLSTTASSAQSCTEPPPVLARDLYRGEMNAVAPYFRFTRQVVEETGWRDGVSSLFAKVVLLAYHVIVTQGQRCNLIFGQASACYDIVAPLLLHTHGAPSSGRASSQGSAYRRSSVLMHCGLGERGAVRERDEFGALIDSSPPAKTVSQYSSPPSTPDSVVAKEPPSGGSSGVLSPFISSPSYSPVFYRTYLPEAVENQQECDGDLSQCDAFSENDSEADELFVHRETVTEEGMPSPDAVTCSWRDRLSFRLLFSPFSNLGGSPERAREAK